MKRLLPALLMNSCVLIFNGTKQDVSIKSMSQNSEIYVVAATMLAKVWFLSH
ncbi:MAG: hypothetical protein LBU33_01790 [Endomicrobium sp.]|jgi:hypothetical protein|nr:hypothetical protein [Endomicrobium sp.]